MGLEAHRRHRHPRKHPLIRLKSLVLTLRQHLKVLAFFYPERGPEITRLERVPQGTLRINGSVEQSTARSAKVERGWTF